MKVRTRDNRLVELGTRVHHMGPYPTREEAQVDVDRYVAEAEAEPGFAGKRHGRVYFSHGGSHSPGYWAAGYIIEREIKSN